jgi:catechol 2,3-dioxygenase-like lactoylglutathione lyase family enzyme
MATIRYLVDDVDAALAFYVDRLGFALTGLPSALRAAGPVRARERPIALTQRGGPAFAIIGRDYLPLWLSGPGTSARQPMPHGALDPIELFAPREG